MGPVDSIKCKNIHMTEVSEGEESEQGMENLFEEIIAENFPNLITEKVTQVQEAQRGPTEINPKRPSQRHIIKMAKVKHKKRILKAARERQILQRSSHKTVS